MPADHKAKRRLGREIEALHDESEEKLGKLQKEYDELTKRIAPLETERRAVEAKMDEMKNPLHAKRCELAKLTRPEKEG